MQLPFAIRPALSTALFTICASIAQAQEGGKSSEADENIMSASTFEDFVSGTTLYFNRGGQPYGAEQYFTDRRVIWTFLDGRCERGAWYSEGDQICFAYETQNAAQCWHFLEAGSDKRARVIGADPQDDLYVVGQNKEALDCPGPGVGVSYTPAQQTGSRARR